MDLQDTLQIITVLIINDLVAGEPDLHLKEFYKITNTSTFIDKSLLIEEFFNHGSVFITAFPGFGKSTNLKMLKLFLEIKVSEKGEPLDVETTSNYELFVKNNMKITKSKVFTEHFGRHPVIYIDYSELCNVTDFDSTLVNVREVARKTFLPHRYLLKNPKLFSSEGGRDQFSYYTHRFFYKKLDAHDLNVGFHWLSRLLYLHFKKPVFVLIDDYNTFFSSLNNKIEDYGRIVKFISGVNSYLLNSNEFLDRAIITGIPESTDAVLPESVKTFEFLQNHPFSKYFGVTENEFEGLLSKLIKNETERVKLRRTCIQNNNLEDVAELEKVLSMIVKNEEERNKIKRMCFENQYGYVVQGTKDKVFRFLTTLNILRKTPERRL